ncbi:MAG: Na+/H+ antiporter subunit E [Opitutales bacterium]
MNPLNLVKKIPAFLDFVVFYAKEVALSNFRVAYDVITPPILAEPGLLEVELSEGLSDLQIMMLANLITMTPGTLSIDVSDDKRRLLIHAMYLDDQESLRRSLKEDFERRVRNVF